EHHVSVLQVTADGLEGERRTAEAPGEVLRALDGPVRDECDRGSPGDEALDGELAGLAGADDQDRTTVQIAEDLLRQRRCGGGHGCRALSDRRLRACLLAGVQRLPE